MTLRLALISLLLCASPATAEHPIAAAQRHQAEANVAYQAGDYEGFTRSMQIAHELNPSSFPTKYNLACGYARIGRNDEALKLLEELAYAKVDYGMADDPDLASLRGTEKFRHLISFLETHIEAVSNSTPVTVIEQIGLIPEGIAFDPASGRLFFGSMRTGDIFAMDGSRVWSKFASVGKGSGRAAIGMAVDPRRKVLWVVGSHFFMAEGFDAEQPLAAGLFGFDLDSGEERFHYAADSSVQGMNDVALASNGDLYISGGGVQMIEADSDTMRPFVTNPAPFGPNGLTVSADGQTLFLSSYPVGIAAIDLQDASLRYLQTPPGASLYGIDGLYWHDGDLIGVQNGIQPWRLLRLSLDDARSAVVDVRVIEFANDAVTATTGAIDGDRIYYIGQGPPPAEPPSHFPAAMAPFLGQTVIMSAPLD